MSRLRALKVPDDLDDEITARMARTGATRTAVMLALMRGESEFDFDAFEGRFLRLASNLPVEVAFREARSEFGV